MKNILKSAFLLAIIGGLSVACNIEPVPQPDTDKTVAGLELSASLPDVQTKTSLGSEPDYNVLWSKGDQISVNGILSMLFQMKITEKLKSDSVLKVTWQRRTRCFIPVPQRLMLSLCRPLRTM